MSTRRAELADPDRRADVQKKYAETMNTLFVFSARIAENFDKQPDIHRFNQLSRAIMLANLRTVFHTTCDLIEWLGGEIPRRER